MVSAVQVKNAQCVIAARSRVGAVVAASFVGCYSPICLKPLYRVTIVVRNRIFS